MIAADKLWREPLNDTLCALWVAERYGCRTRAADHRPNGSPLMKPP